MAIGRTFKEALQKGLRSLEIGRFGLGADGKDLIDPSNPKSKLPSRSDIEQKLATPNSERIFYLRYAIKKGMSLEYIYELTGIDPWFLYQIKQIVEFEERIKLMEKGIPVDILTKAKSWGFSDVQLAYLTGLDEDTIKQTRHAHGIQPVYKLVDTCASTDYDTSDKLYFEPLTKEDVMHIVETEKPMGVIVQFGGQTPLNLSASLHEAGVPILGTHPESINRAEDREQFKALLNKLGLIQPDNGTALSVQEAVAVAERIGYPVIVRPSYVLGGRAMKIVYDHQDIENFTRIAIMESFGHPVLIDKFLEDAVEVDVDAISDGKTTVIGGIMEHIEEAGVHSGDSACVLPPYSIKQTVLDDIIKATKAMARELEVIGLMNVQYAVKDDRLFVLEVNPRALKHNMGLEIICLPRARFLSV
jgi:carbamoylphosphate synthase large subunit